MKSVAVILGSGFSYNAGLPLSKNISTYFNRDNRRNLLHFSSDEWKWYDLASDVDKHNGSLSYDRISYGYILNEIYNQFVQINNEFSNYEEFYQFLIDELNKEDFLELICSNAHKIFDTNNEVSRDNQLYETYTIAFQYPQKKQIINMVNYLISDLLYCRKPFTDFNSNYEPFLNFLSKFKQNYIISLNHDFLLETLLANKKIDFCDGFSKVNSTLQTTRGEKIKCFDGVFNSSIALIKLHGSVDLYKFECANQKGGILNATEEYIYFKTRDYSVKHNPQRIDLNTGKVIQNFHWNITPQFITGTKKEELINSDRMYKKLYEESNTKLQVADTLLIIGYSYLDKHVNDQIINALSSSTLKRVININPSKEFPYALKESIDIVNKKNIEEI